MRAGPTPFESTGHQNLVSNLFSFRRCNFGGRLRRFGSLPLASRGCREPSRRCLASRAATASPEHSVDSAGINRLLVHGQRATGEGVHALVDGLPGLATAAIVTPTASALAEQQPQPSSGSLPWREGVTDHSLEASTSDGGGSGGVNGSNADAADGSGRRPSNSPGCSSGTGHDRDHGGSSLALPGRLHRGRAVPHLSHRNSEVANSHRHGPAVRLPGPETQGTEISLCLRTSPNSPDDESRSTSGGAAGTADIAASVARWLDSGAAGARAGLRQWLLTALHASPLSGSPQAGGGAADVRTDGGTSSAAAGGTPEAPPGLLAGRAKVPAKGLVDRLPPASLQGHAVQGPSGADVRPDAVGLVRGSRAGSAGLQGGGEGEAAVVAAATAVGAAKAAPRAEEEVELPWAQQEELFGLEPRSGLEAEYRSRPVVLDSGGDGRRGGSCGSSGRVEVFAIHRSHPAAYSKLSAGMKTTASITAAGAGGSEAVAAAATATRTVTAAAGAALRKQGAGSVGLAAVTALGDGTADELPELTLVEGSPATSTCSRPLDVRLSRPPRRREPNTHSSSGSSSSAVSRVVVGAECGSSSSSSSGTSNSRMRTGSGASSGNSSSGVSKVRDRAGSVAAAAGEDTDDSSSGQAGSDSETASGSGSGSRSKSAELLTWELTHAADWRRLAVLVQQHGAQLDCIHVSAALVRLAKLHRRDAAALTLSAESAAAAAAAAVAAAAAAADVTVDNGTRNSHRALAEGRVTRARLRAKARAKARVKALGRARPVQHWLTALGERRLKLQITQRHPGGAGPSPSLPPPPPSVTAAAAAAAAASGVEPPSSAASLPTHGSGRVVHPDVARLLDALLAGIPGLMPRADCRTVSNMLWALGVLRPLTRPRHDSSGGGDGGVPRVAAAGRVLAAKMRHFWADTEPQSLALALWGLAGLGLRPGPVWMAEFEHASVRLLPRFSARELSCSLWAMATMRQRPDALWLAAARRAVAAVFSTGPAAGAANLRSIATLLWSFAVLQVPIDGVAAAALLSALTSALQREAGGAGGSGAGAGPQALCMALWGCARLELRPSSELLAAWRRAASGPTLAAAPARAVSCMLWSLARLRSAPPGVWVDEAAAALLTRAQEGAMDRQSLCLTVGALAQLDSHVSPKWLHAFTAAAAPVVRQLDPSELGVVLHGLGRLAGSGGDSGSRGGDCVASFEFLAAADAAAAAALPAATAEDLAGIGGGLAALGMVRSAGLHVGFVRQVERLARAGQLRSGQAAACLEYLAASARPPARCYPAAAAASTSGARGAGDGGAGTGDFTAAVGADGGDARELCYDAVHASVPAQTKQPLPPPQPPPPPPHGLLLELLRLVLTGDLDQYDIFDVGQALCAAAELGIVAATPEARMAVASAAARVCGPAPGARAVLRLLQGMYGMRVRPRAAWLARVAAQIGGRLRPLNSQELELLLRLLGTLQEPPPQLLQPRPTAVQRSIAAVGSSSSCSAAYTEGTGEAWRHQRKPLPSALEALLSAAQPTLASAPVQHLLQLTTAIVAATTAGRAVATAGEPTAVAAAAAATAPSGQQTLLPSPPAVTQLQLSQGWMVALEQATAGKLSLSCVSVSSLVELLACLACLGHAPGPTWAAAWYDSTARRLRSLGRSHLCMALHLQRRLGLQPPVEWLRAHAAALAAAAVAPPPPPPLQRAAEEQRRQRHPPLPPLEVLAAVAELQRLGLDDSTLAAGAVTYGAAAPATAAAAPPPPPPPPSLSGLVAAATAALHGEMLAAEPAAQLETLAALQAIAESRIAPPAPHAGGWAVGAVAMAHSVIVEQPLHKFLADLRPSQSAASDDGGTSSEPVVALLASMVRWDHAPSHRWLSGIARHVCWQAESAAGGVGGVGGGWLAADVARAVCCLAALGYVPEAALAERLQRMLQPALAAEDGGCSGLQPALAAELCAAWAAVRRRPPPCWWHTAEAGALAPSVLAQLPPAALVKLPYSMATLGHVPSYEWLSGYLPKLPAALMTADNAILTASSARAATDLANLAWALGSAVHVGGYPPAVLSSSGALQALLEASGPLLGAMGPGQLVLLVEGLARGRHRLPQAWVQAFAEQVARQLSSCGPSDLISFLYCLAFLDANVPAPWLATALQRTAQLLPPLLRSPEAYRADDLAWAVAKLDRRGALAEPFLELLRRQREAAAAAMAPTSPPPPPPAWILRGVAGDYTGSSSSGGGSNIGSSGGEDPRVSSSASRRGRRRKTQGGSSCYDGHPSSAAASAADADGNADRGLGDLDVASDGDGDGGSDGGAAVEPATPSSGHTSKAPRSNGGRGRGRSVVASRGGSLRSSVRRSP